MKTAGLVIAGVAAVAWLTVKALNAFLDYMGSNKR